MDVIPRRDLVICETSLVFPSGEVVQALKYSDVNAVVLSVRCLIGSVDLRVPIFGEVSDKIESDIRKALLESLADLLLRGFD